MRERQTTPAGLKTSLFQRKDKQNTLIPALDPQQRLLCNNG